MLDQKGREIAIATAVKATAQIAALTGDPFETFYENVDKMTETILQLHETHSAIDAVTGVFPGTEVLTTVIPPIANANVSVASGAPTSVVIPAQTNVVAFPQQAAPAPAPVAAPQPIPGATDGDPAVDALWREFFADYQAGRFTDRWFDNRNSKPKPSSPDFRAKGKDRTNTGLWIKSNGKNPSWVLPALQSIGLA